MILLIGIGVFFAWSTVVAISDFRDRLIPNALVIAGFIFGLLFSISHNSPFGVTWEHALIGAALGLIGLFPFFAMRLMGAADVKVFAVLGAWCGAKILLWLWVIASLGAFVHVTGLMLVTQTPLGALWQRGAPVITIGGRRSTPYAAFLVITAALWLAYEIVIGGMR